MQSEFAAKPLCAALQEMEEAALSIQDNISRCKHDKQQTLEGIVDTEKQVRRCGRCHGNDGCQQQVLNPLSWPVQVGRSWDTCTLPDLEAVGPTDVTSRLAQRTGVTSRLAQRPGNVILLAFMCVVCSPTCWQTAVAWRLVLARTAGADCQI